MTEADALLRARLNAETGRLAWPELARHFARGAVIRVAPGLDLVTVALAVARDDQAAVAAWLADGRVKRASDDDARDWQARQCRFWALVTAPWVLVQEITPRPDAWPLSPPHSSPLTPHSPPMALKATIYKAELQIADLDRNHYGDHSLTLARHPSETDERMMVRLLAFALFARERLAFGKGLCVDDEPDLWCRDLTGAIELWIDVGLPDEKWTRKACGRAARVVIVSYGGRPAEVWWEQNRGKLERLANLAVLNLSAEASQALAGLASRTMRLQCTIQDGQVWLTDGQRTAQLEPAALLARENG